MLNPPLSVPRTDPLTGVLAGRLNETIPGILPDLPGRVQDEGWLISGEGKAVVSEARLIWRSLDNLARLPG